MATWTNAADQTVTNSSFTDGSTTIYYTKYGDKFYVMRGGILNGHDCMINNNSGAWERNRIANQLGITVDSYGDHIEDTQTRDGYFLSYNGSVWDDNLGWTSDASLAWIKAT